MHAASRETGEPTRELALLCTLGRDFYARGDAFGRTGNLSVRSGAEVWITPTGSALNALDPGQLARLSLDGRSVSESRPSKEFPFHLAIYNARPDVAAIVHLHSPHAVALSCLDDLDEAAPLPPITPYFVMRVAPLGVVAYHRPGSADLANAVGAASARFDCLLLRNHGLICTGSSMAEAADRAIELEETARLFFLLRGERTRALTPAQVEDLGRTFR